MVSSDMSLVVGYGDECPLSQGDVIERTTETPDDDGNVNVKVVASTKSDCAVGKEGPVSTDDLQEMYNSFREGLKDGMGELAKKNGTGGLPKAPDTTTVNGDVPAPPPARVPRRHCRISSLRPTKLSLRCSSKRVLAAAGRNESRQTIGGICRTEMLPNFPIVGVFIALHISTSHFNFTI